jgi:acetolactate synthase-1/2/3 large subunit
VVLALPVDMLAESACVLDAEPYRSVRPHPGARELERMRALLAAAERPLMLVGGSGWNDQARADIVAFAGANDLPTVSSFRRQDVFDNHHPNYIGHLSSRVDPALVETFKRADLVLVVGSRFGERTSLRYTLMEVPRPEKTFIHVHADADEIGRVYQPALGIASGVPEFASAARALAPLDGSRWARWAEEGRAAYEASLVPRPLGGDLDLGEVMAALAERLPEDAIITSDAGTSVSWPYQYIPLGARQRHLGPTSGSMGYAVPAAVAAAIVNPERIAVALVGDGGFLMTGNELATAVHYRVAPLVVLFNNGMYGSVRANQERRFPGRVVATGLTNPGFAHMARSFHAHGEVVTRTHEFGPAFERAVASGRPGVIELLCDPEQLDPFTTLSGVRARALGAAT